MQTKKKPTAGESLMLKAALEYAAQGLPVFPCVYAPGEKRNKKPHTHHGFKDATTDPQVITRWWTQWPEAHVAIATGKPSGIVVLDLDVDEKKGKNGPAEIPDWESRSNVIVRTPRGGVHLWFKYEPERPILSSSDKIAKSVDVRGDGGYAIVPHPRNGSAYIFEKGCAQDLKDLKPFPEDLRKRLPTSTPDAKPNAQPQAPIKLVELAVSLIPNADVGWDDWAKMGLAIYAATGGKGLTIFDTFSQKSQKYDARETADKWCEFHKSPPNRIGAGTLFHHAYEAAGPGWDNNFHDELAKELFAYSEERSRLTIEFLEKHVWNKSPPTVEAAVVAPPASPAITINPVPPKAKKEYLQSSAEFVSGYVPPDYLIDGIVQRRSIYSLTAPTNTGKTAVALLIAAYVALGLTLSGREVEKGKVLYFAGENPDDVRSRWIMLCEELNQNSDDMDVVFLPGTPKITDKIIHRAIENEACDFGQFSLLIVDTSAAYFDGEDENDNTQLGNHARALRTYVETPGGPTVLVTCHPKKDFDPNNLLPRGGGAFLNEVDGNLVLLKEPGTMVVTLDTHGKFRGPEFEQISFQLTPKQSEKLKDKKGRLIWTVTAAPITQEARSELEDAGRDKQNELLLAMKTNPNASLSELAVALNKLTDKGECNKTYVRRLMLKLEADKLVANKRSHYELTKKGNAEIVEIEAGGTGPRTTKPTITKNLFIQGESEKGLKVLFPGEDKPFWLARSFLKVNERQNEDKTYEITMEAWQWSKRKAAKSEAEPELDDKPF
jgi:hypothetical protein